MKREYGMAAAKTSKRHTHNNKHSLSRKSLIVAITVYWVTMSSAFLFNRMQVSLILSSERKLHVQVRTSFLMPLR